MEKNGKIRELNYELRLFVCKKCQIIFDVIFFDGKIKDIYARKLQQRDIFKTCTRCKEVKSILEFYEHKKQKSGDSFCKECRIKIGKKIWQEQKDFLNSIKNVPRCSCCKILLNQGVCSTCKKENGKEFENTGICIKCKEKGSLKEPKDSLEDIYEIKMKDLRLKEY